MHGWLKFSNAIDWISEHLGTLAAWTVLFAAVISAGNAFVRYGMDFSSNGWLEIQWYLCRHCNAGSTYGFKKK